MRFLDHCLLHYAYDHLNHYKTNPSVLTIGCLTTHSTRGPSGVLELIELKKESNLESVEETRPLRGQGPNPRFVVGSLGSQTTDSSGKGLSSPPLVCRRQTDRVTPVVVRNTNPRL